MICDTSGLLSALVANQPEHERSLLSLNSASTLVISPLMLCELDYLATSRLGDQVSVQLMKRLHLPVYDLATLDKSDLLQAIDVMGTYSDLGVGLTDASLVVLAKRYKTNEILTLDQGHFRAMRGLDGRHFKLLPFDMD